MSKKVNKKSKNIVNIDDYKSKKIKEDKRAFDEIMADIFQGLSGDIKKDYNYLQSQIEKYKDHEYGTEIERECGRKMVELLPKDIYEKLDKVYMDTRDAIEASLRQVEQCVAKKDIDKAEKILNPLLEKIKELEKTKIGKDDKVTIYSEFREPFEEALFKMRFNPKKEVRERSIYYGNVYYLYGYILIEKGNFVGAREMLKKAMLCAPVNAQYAIEYGETYKSEFEKTHDMSKMEEFYKCAKETIKIAYKPEEIARCFRNFAYYFVEKKKYNEAVICHILGAQFSENVSIMQSELFYIQEKYKKVNMYPKIEDIKRFCKKYDIPIKCDKDIEKLADDGIGYILNLQNYELKKYYINTITPLISNEMREKLTKVIVGASCMAKNDDSLKTHRIYDLKNINKIKSIKEKSDTEIDLLDTIKFGKMIQSNEEKIDIEWVVLEKQNDRALLMSKYILDCKTYDRNKDCITWEKSSLRKWLNNEFYKDTFSEEEKMLILESELVNTFSTKWEETCGNITKDKIFCLSTKEIEKYYKDDKRNKKFFSNRYLGTRATPNVILKTNILIFEEQDEWYVGNSYFWTRSVSKKDKQMMPVNEDGTYAGGMPANIDVIGVRPAMWVKIS